MKTTNLEKPDIGTLRKQKIANKLAEIPKKYRKIYKKAVETNNKNEAIKAFCLECVCWQKNEIIKCPCLACPLYGVRPYTEQERGKRTQKSEHSRQNKIRSTKSEIRNNGKNKNAA